MYIYGISSTQFGKCSTIYQCFQMLTQIPRPTQQNITNIQHLERTAVSY